MLIHELADAGQVITCGPDLTLRRAARRMAENGVGSLAVVRGHGDLVGIFTERDLLDAVAAGAETGKAKVTDWMTGSPDVVEADVTVDDAAAWMLGSGYRHLPVMRSGTLVGIVSIKDVLWAIVEPVLAGAAVDAEA